MPLLVSCSCGKKLKVRDELIGKKVRCPACGGVIAVRAEPVEPEVVEEPSESSQDTETSLETTRKRGPKPPPVPRTKPSSPPLEEEAPAEDEREAGAAFWECRREFTNGLVVVTDDALWFGKLADKALKSAKKQLAAGASPEDVLDEQAAQSRLRFADITEITFNKRQKQIQVIYPSGEESETSNFYFEDHATRDEVFKDLRRRVGTDWVFKRRDLSAFQAMLAPLATIGVMLLVFSFLVFLAWGFNQPADGNRRVRTNIWGLILAYTVGWLGPIWTGVIGVVAILLTCVWLVFRITDPPIEISLKPKAEAPKKEEDEEEEDQEEEDRPRSKSRRRSRADDD